MYLSSMLTNLSFHSESCNDYNDYRGLMPKNVCKFSYNKNKVLNQCYIFNLNRFGASLTSNNANTSSGESRTSAPAARRTTSYTSPATRIIGFSEGPRARDRDQGI